MEEEIVDIIGDVKYTDSQKSVATSNVYSMDFIDSSSDKNNSSGKETYVIEWEDSEGSEIFPLHGNTSVINLKDKKIEKSSMPLQINRDVNFQSGPMNKADRAANANHNKYPFVAQEIFTQTSKTIIELAETECVVKKKTENKTLETQTSLISITENKTVEYRIKVSGSHKFPNRNEIVNNCIDNISDDCTVSCDQILNNSLEDGSSKFPASETENERSDDNTSNGSDDKYLHILNEDSKENMLIYEQNECQYENTSDFEESMGSDIDEDSLMECQQNKTVNSDTHSDTSEVPKSIDNDIEELYTKLSERIDLHLLKNSELDIKIFGSLTPLTEESSIKKESLMDITPNINTIINPIENDNDVLFTNKAGMNVKLFPKEEMKEKEPFKLPPLLNDLSCPNSPHLNFLFSAHPNSIHCKSGALPCLVKDQKKRSLDRWEIGTKDLASGESPLINGRSDPVHLINETVQLPPIYVENHLSRYNKTNSRSENIDHGASDKHHDPISIKEKIKELKMSKTAMTWSQKFGASRSESRSNSPSTVSPDESGLCDAAERGCEALCAELLKRLRSSSWFEVADTLEEIPKVLEKFWGVIAEQRIADLIRQVSAHIESPRTQVVRTACNTLASILKKTTYTKKPDFYEAVTILLIKTGSFNRPVRRAANVALDEIVCGVELTHAVSALCVHGVTHKSSLVRCAAARLLVVCCALGGGGRGLLRARPPSAASARSHALRALAALLEDKSTDARKYAQRLYSMLRPLTNFEAYYLTDVDVELASRQMKKYDQLLLSGQHKESR